MQLKSSLEGAILGTVIGVYAIRTSIEKTFISWIIGMHQGIGTKRAGVIFLPGGKTDRISDPGPIPETL